MNEMNQPGGGAPLAETGKEDHPGIDIADVPATLSPCPAISHNGAPASWRDSRIDEDGLDDRGKVFFAAIAMTRMPMIVTDPLKADHPIVFVNGAFLDLTGYSQDEVLGRNCRFLQGPRTDPETVQHIGEALAMRQPFAAEILNYRRDGTPFWNALFIGPIYDCQGALRYFFSSQLDVTRRRTSEEAFRQSQKLEAIGQLTAGLAHDFNNMLQVISGNLEIAALRLQNGGDAGQALKAIERAERGAGQAAKVTTQLLAFARKTRLNPKPINLNLMIMQFGERVSRTLGSAIIIDLKLDLALPSCIADAGQIEMALLNVLMNARDAMPEGGVVTIATRVAELDAAEAAEQSAVLPGRYVVLSVADQGEGMDRDVMARAIEPFFTTKGPGKGTGLGLAMVHGFVRQSGGRIEISSEKGKGTTIRMLFPEARPRESMPARPAEARPAEARPAEARGGKEVILVVDDSADVLDITTAQLQSLGYRTITAHDGASALAILQSNSGEPIDLLFSDIAMPGGINGIKLAEHAAKLRPEMPVLLATGYIEDLIPKGSSTSAMDVIGKPYRKYELAARVRAALGRRGQSAHAWQGLPRKEG
jgi:PAS domain S-box-containing protein